MSNILDNIGLTQGGLDVTAQVTNRRRLAVSANGPAIAAGAVGVITVNIPLTDNLNPARGIWFEFTSARLLISAGQASTATIVSADSTIQDSGGNVILPYGQFVATVNALTTTAGASAQAIFALTNATPVLSFFDVNQLFPGFVNPLKLVTNLFLSAAGAGFAINVITMKVWMIYRMLTGLQDG